VADSHAGEYISLDNTFKAAKKAVVLEKMKARTKLLKGGILSVLNEKNEIIGWVHTLFFCGLHQENGLRP
jgi:hypothetical protein